MEDEVTETNLAPRKPWMNSINVIVWARAAEVCAWTARLVRGGSGARGRRQHKNVYAWLRRLKERG